MNLLKNYLVKRITENNVTGEYLVGGKRTFGFLIFPGDIQTMYSYYDLIEGYEDKFKVISLSINGFTDLAAYFDFVNKILKTKKTNKVVIYGLSLGRFISLKPNRLARLCPALRDKGEVKGCRPQIGW